MSKGTAVIVGAGSGVSASLARQLAAKGYDLVLGARNTAKLSDLAAETNAKTVSLDGSDPAQMAAVFEALPSDLRVAIYNPSARVRGSVTELDPEAVRNAMQVTAFGAFLLGQQAAIRMAQNAGETKGTILFTGASAGVKGFANSAPFAMGKFAQRGLAQSMARELHPQGIHVAWVNIDGAIATPGRENDGSDRMLDPEALAVAYLQLIDQHRSAWSSEITLRPWVESF
ncbi:SDR family NAD(P)-dependent oxidoreductase [uncultured Roseobacter sp.]|uniref:SDR family NAD(P)-dependent oxidoreductase n=1 Tax=uncultured Roseobacter sp. TaxID=114847 RepID=UPI0026345011|nr:SDR family NAD(P)-dependent oxidoreductase [uncultured Roseobacter sp.]